MGESASDDNAAEGTPCSKSLRESVPDPASATRSATQVLVAPGQFEPFSRADQRQGGRVCLRGLLLDGRRKSVEPMAARLGEDGNRQALAHF